MSRIDQFHDLVSQGYRYNTSTNLSINNTGFGASGCSSSGSIWNDVLSTVLGVGMMVGMGAVQNSAASGAQGAQAGQGNAASVTAFQKAMTTYVEADAALDSAHKNMRTALDSLKDMQGQLNKITSGEARRLLDNANQRKSNNQEPDYYNNYVTDQDTYNRVSSAFQQYSQLKSEVDGLTSQANQIENSHTNEITVTGTVAKAKNIEGQTTNYIDSSGQEQQLKFNGDGKDATLVNSTAFHMRAKENGKVVYIEDPSAKSAALAKAQSLDTQFKQREAVAQQYNDIQAQIAGTKEKMVQLNAESDVDFSDANAAQQVEDLKPKTKDNSYDVEKCQGYEARRDAIEADIDKYTKMTSDEYKNELKTKIAAKKEEIKTKLKPAIEAAQSKFDTAKAAIEAIQRDVQDISAREGNLAIAQRASKAVKKEKRDGINFFNPKNWGSSQQTKYYRQQRREVEAAQSNFAQVYGTDHTNVSAILQNAQAAVDRETIIIDPSEYNNL